MDVAGSVCVVTGGGNGIGAEAVRLAETRFGPVDLYASNAGIGAGEGMTASVEMWEAVWRVNVLAHVLAARAVLPSMLERGEGWLLQTASAAGLLLNLGDAATRSAPSPSRSTTTTPAAPSAPKRRARAAPIPLPPPVTTQTETA